VRRSSAKLKLKEGAETPKKNTKTDVPAPAVERAAAATPAPVARNEFKNSRDIQKEPIQRFPRPTGWEQVTHIPDVRIKSSVAHVPFDVYEDVVAVLKMTEWTKADKYTRVFKAADHYKIKIHTGSM
jgi:hypothetical protein